MICTFPDTFLHPPPTPCSLSITFSLPFSHLWIPLPLDPQTSYPSRLETSLHLSHPSLLCPFFKLTPGFCLLLPHFSLSVLPAKKASHLNEFAPSVDGNNSLLLEPLSCLLINLNRFSQNIFNHKTPLQND